MAGEKKLQTKILNDLRSYGGDICCFKIMKCSDNGIPDIFFTTRKTGSWFVECKDEGKKPEPHQVVIIKSLNSCGANAVSISSWVEWVCFKVKVNLRKH